MRSLIAGTAALVPILSFLSCTADVKVPTGAQLACDVTADCPTGMVCTQAGLCLPETQVDATLPDVKGLPAIIPSSGTIGTKFTIALTVTTALAEPPTVTLEVVPSVTAPCVASGTNTFSCTYVATGHENSGAGGVVTLDVTLVDQSGHTTLRSFASALTLDFLAPSIAGTPSLVVSPAPGSVLPEVSAATVGSKVELVFILSEPVAQDPIVTATLGTTSLPFTRASVAGDTWVYDLTIPGVPLPPGGTYDVTVSAVDPATNSATLTLALPAPGLVLITTGPTTPDTSTASRIVYSRAPWGTAATSGVPAFSLSGSAGATSTSGEIVAYDGPDQTTASELGRGPAGADGSFGPIALRRSCHQPVVYVGVADATGTLSSLAPIHDVSWTASFGGKITGSTIENPHLLELASVFDLGSSSSGDLFGSITSDQAVSAEPLSYAGLTAAGGSPLDGSTGVTWQARRLATPPVSGNVCGMADDPGRGRVVLYCGADVWEWDGELWLDLAPGAAQPANAWGMTYDSLLGHVVAYDGTTPWSWDGVSWRALPTSASAPQLCRIAYDSGRDRVVAQDGQLTWEWDGTGWANVTPATGQPNPPARGLGMLTYDETRGLTVLFGGTSADDPNLSYGDTWTWNGTTWTNVSPQSSPPPRVNGALAFNPVHQLVVLFGGVMTGAQTDTELNDVWTWDGAQWTNVTPAGTAPQARRGAVLSFDSVIQKMLMFGGASVTESGMTTQFSDVWAWSGSSWVEITPTTNAPAPRTDHTVTFDSTRQRMVLFGGADNDGDPLQDTWEWDGYRWLNPTPTLSPPARTDAMMAYDEARGRTILFGGSYPTGDDGLVTFLNDVWEWDGTNWTNVTPASGQMPDPRSYGSLVYDSALQRTILFGGDNTEIDDTGTRQGGMSLADLWTWDGTQWTALTPANPPSARMGNAAYDEARDRLVLLGGTAIESDGTVVTTNDTWEWDGTSWTEVLPDDPNRAGPPEDSVWGIAYDTARKHVVVDVDPEDGTWEWDGQQWHAVPVVTPQPSDRILSSMTYDSVRQRLVLMGGNAASVALNDVWEGASNVSSHAAAVTTFSFAAASEPDAVIGDMTVHVIAGGTGTLASTTPGTTLAAWDGTLAEWRALATNPADVSTPADLSYDLQAPDAGHCLLTGSQTINLAAFSTAPRGNGFMESEVSVSQFELTVRYRR